MLRTYLYIPEPLNKRINTTAKLQRKSKAEVMRYALENGLDLISAQGGAETLLKLAKLAESLPPDPNAPNDLSINHDYYAWGGKKRKYG